MRIAVNVIIDQPHRSVTHRAVVPGRMSTAKGTYIGLTKPILARSVCRGSTGFRVANDGRQVGTTICESNGIVFESIQGRLVFPQVGIRRVVAKVVFRIDVFFTEEVGLRRAIFDLPYFDFAPIIDSAVGPHDERVSRVRFGRNIGPGGRIAVGFRETCREPVIRAAVRGIVEAVTAVGRIIAFHHRRQTADRLSIVDSVCESSPVGGRRSARRAVDRRERRLMQLVDGGPISRRVVSIATPQIVTGCLFDVWQDIVNPRTRLLFPKTSIGISCPFPRPAAGREKPLGVFVDNSRKRVTVLAYSHIASVGQLRGLAALPAATTRPECR